MIFSEAVEALRRGCKVYRQQWKAEESTTIPLGVQAETHFIVNVYGYHWTPSLHDLTATDWMIHVPKSGEPQ